MPPPKKYPVRIATQGVSELWAFGWDDKLEGYTINIRWAPGDPWNYDEPIPFAQFMAWGEPTEWDFDPQYL
jgi:hypothetical protein